MPVQCRSHCHGLQTLGPPHPVFPIAVPTQPRANRCKMCVWERMSVEGVLADCHQHANHSPSWWQSDFPKQRSKIPHNPVQNIFLTGLRIQMQRHDSRCSCVAHICLIIFHVLRPLLTCAEIGVGVVVVGGNMHSPFPAHECRIPKPQISTNAHEQINFLKFLLKQVKKCQVISPLCDLKLWVEGIVMIVLSLHTVWLKVQGKKA